MMLLLNGSTYAPTGMLKTEFADMYGEAEAEKEEEEEAEEG